MQEIRKNIEPSKFIIGISVVILLVLLGYFQTKRHELEFIDTPAYQAQQSDEVNLQTNEQLQEPPFPPAEITTLPTTTSTDSDTFSRQGTLLASDNLNRGNFMLQTATSTFYFRTSRDYTGLLGKSVTVQGKGSVEQFSLVDIIENK